MKNVALSGNPCVGNPHVRYDEEGVASGKPRQASLLYKAIDRIVVGMVAVGLAFPLSGEESASLDFSVTAGAIRRELHSSGWGAQLTGCNSKRYERLKPLRLKAARTHDWAHQNTAQRICDMHFLFPLLHADTQDPRNYFFGPTDEILEMTIEDLDMDILFRMGTSIENVNARLKSEKRPPRYYNSVEPSDWDQFVRAQTQIIRHYTEGWANGYRWADRIRYWELWNEPDDAALGGSWCLADRTGDWTVKSERFWAFAVYVLKKLKAEFPQLKFGAPAVCYWDEPFLTGFLKKCRAEGYAPDFISWHSYGDRPEVMLSQPATARKFCDGLGFAKTELIIDEWHYIPCGAAWGWFGAEPEVYAKLLSPEDGLTSADAAVYALQVIVGLQSTVLDQSYYYGCSHDGWFWGYRRPDNGFNKSFYALRMFGDVVGACETFVKGADPTEPNPVRAFGAWSRDGKRAYLIATVYRGTEATFEVCAKGLGDRQLKSVTVVDWERDGEKVDPVSVVTRDGDTLRFRKAKAERAAAYLLEFE